MQSWPHNEAFRQVESTEDSDNRDRKQYFSDKGYVNYGIRVTRLDNLS